MSNRPKVTKFGWVIYHPWKKEYLCDYGYEDIGKSMHHGDVWGFFYDATVYAEIEHAQDAVKILGCAMSTILQVKTTVELA